MPMYFLNMTLESAIGRWNRKPALIVRQFGEAPKRARGTPNAALAHPTTAIPHRLLGETLPYPEIPRVGSTGSIISFSSKPTMHTSSSKPRLPANAVISPSTLSKSFSGGSVARRRTAA
jgi:hypothetical protein